LDFVLTLDPGNADRYSFLGANPVSYVEADGHTRVIDPGGPETKLGSPGLGIQQMSDLVVGRLALGCFDKQVAYQRYCDALQSATNEARDSIFGKPNVFDRIGNTVESIGKSALGIDDIADCWNSRSATSCGLAVAGLLPAGKLAKGARYAIDIQRGAKTARAAEEVSVVDKAAELRAIAGRNRVSIETPNGRLSVDLEGKPHFEKTLGRYVDTPQVKFETRHIGPDGRVSYTSGPVREATQADLRLIARVLSERGR
jgi:hypothetical protein